MLWRRRSQKRGLRAWHQLSGAPPQCALAAVQGLICLRSNVLTCGTLPFIDISAAVRNRAIALSCFKLRGLLTLVSRRVPFGGFWSSLVPLGDGSFVAAWVGCSGSLAFGGSACAQGNAMIMAVPLPDVAEEKDVRSAGFLPRRCSPS